MTTCIGHAPCTTCGDRDSVACYSDGHGFCFHCSTTYPRATCTMPTAPTPPPPPHIPRRRHRAGPGCKNFGCHYHGALLYDGDELVGARG
jgi:hypothetical protein